jgi:hypothetical protein
MGEAFRFPLQVIDGLRLDKELRNALQPGRVLHDDAGAPRTLPRYFYEIPSWDDAMRVKLSPNFGLYELIQTDVREAEPLRSFPRYVPCAITVLGYCLEQFRAAVGTFVHIAANGGYRSPGHALTTNASTHCWATAVNVYRIGDTFLDDREAIERFAAIARSVLPGVWTRPVGTVAGSTDDHLHLDFGYLVSVPRGVPVDTASLSEEHAGTW